MCTGPAKYVIYDPDRNARNLADLTPSFEGQLIIYYELETATTNRRVRTLPRQLRTTRTLRRESRPFYLRF